EASLILTVEEAVRWNGQGVALDPYEIFRAYPSESEKPDSLLYRQAGDDYRIVFHFKPLELDGKPFDGLTIATCIITVPGTEEFLTSFSVEAVDKNSDSKKIPVDNTRFSSYFTLLVHEEWLCIGKDSSAQFRRIVNKYEMKAKTPFPISKIKGFDTWLGDYHVEKRNRTMIPIFTEVKYMMIDSRPTQFLKYSE
ncbi:uncharacterized protein LOC120356548, partial [Nilaparvata lugens]|uniref:uncharacterized protein LOC120356548 n=1 Tax=Nilaparvata lugens TaxID=108931 RepID=UPI00193D8C9E